MKSGFDASVPIVGTRKYQILAALGGVALACVLAWSQQKIGSLERTIEMLRASLKQKEAGQQHVSPPSRVTESAQLLEDAAGGIRERGRSEPAASGRVAGSYQILKELDADSANDPRSYAERLQELLADKPTEEEAAIACRFIFGKADDTRGLPDYALQALYASQTNPDLRRVIAQVMAQRGDDTLLANQVAEAQSAMKAGAASERLAALNQLGKIHSVQAVEAIAPALQDSDSTVRVAALFALRDSGNQRHVNLAEPLLDDPDPSVSTLAANVVSALRNLSSTARTSYSRADIEAELPPIAAR